MAKNASVEAVQISTALYSINVTLRDEVKDKSISWQLPGTFSRRESEEMLPMLLTIMNTYRDWRNKYKPGVVHFIDISHESW